MLVWGGEREAEWRGREEKKGERTEMSQDSEKRHSSCFAQTAKRKIRCTMEFNGTHEGEEQSAAEFGVLCTIFLRLVRPSKLGATFVSAFWRLPRQNRRINRATLNFLTAC